MSDTRQEHDVQADTLGDQIDGLLDDMESAANDVARQLMGESASPAPTPAVPDPEPGNDAAPQPADESLGDEKTKPEIDTTAQPADETPEEEPKPEIDATPQPADESEAAELDEQVGKLVDDAIESADQPPIPTDIDSLDDELAALANDLLGTDSGQIEGTITDAGAAIDHSADPAPAPEPAPGADALTPTEPPAAQTPTKSQPAVETIEEPTPEPASARRKSAKIVALGTAIKAIEFTGRPLANKPTSARQTIGWFALITLFNATMAWTFVLFIREPVQPVANHTPATLTVPQDALETPNN